MTIELSLMPKSDKNMFKPSTIVILDSYWIENYLEYNSRIVIYDRRAL